MQVLANSRLSTAGITKLSNGQVMFLDAVRGTAALVVLFGHIYSKIPGDFSFGKSLPWHSLAVVVFFFGFLVF